MAVRRKLAKVGDTVRYKTLSGVFEGKVVGAFSDYLTLELSSPRMPYYHEQMIGYKEEDLLKDNIRRHSDDYEIVRYAEVSND